MVRESLESLPFCLNSGANSQVTVHVLILSWWSLCFFLFRCRLCTITYFVTGAIQGVEKNGLALLACASTVLLWALLALSSDQHSVAKLCSRWAKHRGRHHRGENLREAWGKYSPKSTQKHEQAGHSLHSCSKGDMGAVGDGFGEKSCH